MKQKFPTCNIACLNIKCKKEKKNLDQEKERLLKKIIHRKSLFKNVPPEFNVDFIFTVMFTFTEKRIWKVCVEFFLVIIFLSS